MRLLSCVAAATTCLLAIGAHPASAQSSGGATATGRPARATGVYVATNAIAGNAVLAYRAASNGTLTLLKSYPTGGLGVGPNKIPTLTPNPIDPLGSQDSLIAHDGALLVVNAGSGTISSFTIAADQTLTPRSVAPSGGTFPTSIAAHGALVYVANAGNPAKGTPASISGFTLTSDGKLTPIAGSTRTLSQPAASVAATAVFSPDGRFLVTTDSGADRITTFAVRGDGRLGDPISTPSVGAGPFGAAFHGGALLVAETEAGIPGATSVTSYLLRRDGYVQPISSAIRSGETAGCWITAREVSPLAFVADTGTGTISSFVQGYDGAIRLLAGTAIPVVAGSAPVDLGLSRDGRYLYELFDGLGVIGAYKVAANGSLAGLGDAGGLSAAGAQGIAVY